MSKQVELTRRGVSRAADARTAARELHAQIEMPNAGLGVFFCAPDYDHDALADEMASLFGDTPLIGCTSSGEIGPGGYAHGTLVGAALSADYVTAETASFDHLSRFEMSDGADMSQRLLHALRERAPDASAENSFAMLLVDGLSAREESVTAAVHPSLQGISMFGGSASDEFRLKETRVYHDGTLQSDRFVLAAVHTQHPFRVFRHQHYVATGEPLVVTAADSARRIIHELNGRPAAEEYARTLGQELLPDSPQQFSANPMIVRVGGEDYLRSPMECLDDGSVRFACAIATGLVLSAGRGVEMVASLETQFDDLRNEIGQPELVIACDCLGRLVEAERKDVAQQVGGILNAANALGLATYGEQFNSMHVNQTLTGVALGRAPVA